MKNTQTKTINKNIQNIELSDKELNAVIGYLLEGHMAKQYFYEISKHFKRNNTLTKEKFKKIEEKVFKEFDKFFNKL